MHVPALHNNPLDWKFSRSGKYDKKKIKLDKFNRANISADQNSQLVVTRTEILLNQTEIRLHLPCTDRFGTKRTVSV